jgi:hypothetical protein
VLTGDPIADGGSNSWIAGAAATAWQGRRVWQRFGLIGDESGDRLILASEDP